MSKQDVTVIMDIEQWEALEIAARLGRGELVGLLEDKQQADLDTSISVLNMAIQIGKEGNS